MNEPNHLKFNSLYQLQKKDKFKEMSTAQKAFVRARPDETLTFRYTTSSSDIQKKLGVK